MTELFRVINTRLTKLTALGFRQPTQYCHDTSNRNILDLPVLSRLCEFRFSSCDSTTKLINSLVRYAGGNAEFRYCHISNCIQEKNELQEFITRLPDNVRVLLSTLFFLFD